MLLGRRISSGQRDCCLLREGMPVESSWVSAGEAALLSVRRRIVSGHENCT